MVAVAIGVAGLAVLVVQLAPWAPRELTTAGGAGSFRVHRRSAERRLATAVDRITGVHDASVRLRGRGLRWRLRVVARGRPDTRAAVTDRIRTELGRLDAPPPDRLRIVLRRPKRVS